MQFSFTFRQFEGTEALKEMIREKFESRFSRLLDGRDADVRITISSEKAWTTVDVVMVALGGEVFKCTEKTTDLYPTIDVVIDKLERQMIRRKDKVRERKRRSA